MYSISFATFMCQWIPAATPEPLAAAADVHLQRRTDSVFFSSSAYSTMRRTLSPWNFSGQWHCSQVSRAGRRFCTGDGIGRE